ncbi:hypothetical protein [Corynebacterium striatum]|uniref:hypothetical protein n=1 Tax=Corynebacterium striatum TaxID=43770 RepID=UPI0015F0415C|nr:hypothetical protein [Corynebacterium striatum]
MNSKAQPISLLTPGKLHRTVFVDHHVNAVVIASTAVYGLIELALLPIPPGGRLTGGKLLSLGELL